MAGIYIHIPFCKRRCIYCDFFSTTASEKKDDYIRALCKEIKNRANYLGGENIDTIYFGGGTPSLLGKNDFLNIFNAIYENHRVNPQAEITIEANPDDLTDEYVKMLSTLPFNRLSMGIQTFDDDILSLLKRRHSARQSIDAFRRCRDAGFRNISIDLMYGLPGQNMETWNNDLDTVIALMPEHISAYHLTYEEGTQLYRLKEEKKVSEVDEELSGTLFETLVSRLKGNGYVYYEISNFCRPGMYSRHNSSYWTGIKYLGCGPSAHSYDGHSRQWNISSLEKYINGTNNGLDISETEELNIYTRYNDFVVTAIRTAWGMSLERLKVEFGNELYDYCLKMARTHISRGTLEIKDNALKLTQGGIFISDGIMSDMLWVD